jgi:hypothetical protein
MPRVPSASPGEEASTLSEDPPAPTASKTLRSATNEANFPTKPKGWN